MYQINVTVVHLMNSFAWSHFVEQQIHVAVVCVCVCIRTVHVARQPQVLFTPTNVSHTKERHSMNKNDTMYMHCIHTQRHNHSPSPSSAPSQPFTSRSSTMQFNAMQITYHLNNKMAISGTVYAFMHACWHSVNQKSKWNMQTHTHTWHLCQLWDAVQKIYGMELVQICFERVCVCVTAREKIIIFEQWQTQNREHHHAYMLCPLLLQLVSCM